MLFRDRRFVYTEKNTLTELMRENDLLKNTVQNMRLVIYEKDKVIKRWEQWWNTSGRFIVERNRMLEQTIKQLEKENQELKFKNQKFQNIQITLETLKNSTTHYPAIQTPHPPSTTFSSLQLKWVRILKPPFRCVIIGKAGSGKSALGHFLAELFHFQKSVYILGFPQDKVRYLPEYFNIITSLNKLPCDSICLIDESYLLFFSRESTKDTKNKKLAEILGLARQKNCSLIFITQSTGLIDRNILSLTDYIIIKELSNTLIEFERREIKQLLKKADERFKKIIGDKRRYSYVISAAGDFEDLIENSLPTYWNEEISKAYASGILSEEKIGTRITNEEKKNLAKQYRNQGYSYKQIAKILGVSKATIINWTKHDK